MRPTSALSAVWTRLAVHPKLRKPPRLACVWTKMQKVRKVPEASLEK